MSEESYQTAIDQIAATPDMLRALMAGLSDDDARWKPSPERMSVAEVLEHMSHVEAHGYRVRVDRILAEHEPVVENYDQEAFISAGQYSGRDPEESFAHFEEQRLDNVDLLRDLEPKDFARGGVHSVYGRFTLAELVHEWAFHDLGHVRQITELVRSRLYHPRMGPFTPHFAVKP